MHATAAHAIEPQWIDAFGHTFKLCALARGDTAAILCETQSRRILIELARLACARIGVHAFEICVPTPRQTAPLPIRSTGASHAIAANKAVLAALAASTLVIDCTVEGLLHAPELPQILQGGARVLMVSNEHPEILERCVPQMGDEALVRDAIRRLKAARQMQVTSASGTALTIDLQGARIGGTWGFCSKPGQVAHWPGALALAFPAAGSVDGELVLAPGDVNLTFKEYLRSPIQLTIANDEITEIDGDSVDADLMRATWSAWAQLEGHRACYAVSHVGFGLNERARWDSMSYYDKSDFNGTEMRAFAGNFLYSTGANEVAGRHTLGHFDLPLRGCTVALDDEVVVDAGQLV
jgi:2,5-dihydroxypyridine 5,6-dioxygenase